MIKVPFIVSAIFLNGKYWCFCWKNKFIVVWEEMHSSLRVKPEEKNGNVKTSANTSAAFQNANTYVPVENLRFFHWWFQLLLFFFTFTAFFFGENCIFKPVYNTIKSTCLPVLHWISDQLYLLILAVRVPDMVHGRCISIWQFSPEI